MNGSDLPPRSPELMCRDDTTLLVVDVQTALLPHIDGRDLLRWNILRLVDGARALGLNRIATELDFQELGATDPELAQRMDEILRKSSFSCRRTNLFRQLAERGRYKVLVCGLEAHIAVQQTVIDLMGDGFRVYVAADAVGSRRKFDCQVALGRMDSAGATLTTVEAALCEWCESADESPFERIRRLVWAAPPER